MLLGDRDIVVTQPRSDRESNRRPADGMSDAQPVAPWHPVRGGCPFAEFPTRGAKQGDDLGRDVTYYDPRLTDVNRFVC